uniref:BCL2 like 11 n=1 Tax=Cyprinus carpio TaxID=7962 RepID=A0A8C2ILL5_CYPCA
MSDTSREQTLANGPASRGGGESAGGGAVLRTEHFDFPQPSEGDSLRGGISMSNSHQSRSPMSRTFSRSSSGYFSVDSDSVPSSPLMPNISEAQDDQNDEVWFDEPSHQHVRLIRLCESCSKRSNLHFLSVNIRLFTMYFEACACTCMSLQPGSFTISCKPGAPETHDHSV